MSFEGILGSYVLQSMEIRSIWCPKILEAFVKRPESAGWIKVNDPSESPAANLQFSR